PGLLSLGFLWAGSRAGEEERLRIREEFGSAALYAHHSARLAWEVPVAGGVWQIVPAMDETRSLTLNGTVTVTIPTNAVTRAIDGGAPRFWIRSRIASGSYDRPPRLVTVFLNAVEAEQAVPPAANATVPVADIASTPAPGPQAYRLGVCSGDPHQKFRLPIAFSVTESMRLFTLEGDAPYRRWIAWERVDDLVASGPADSHYAFEDARAEVTFGDGERGRLAPRGSPCFIEYHATRGSAGSVASGLVRSVDSAWPALSVINPGPSESGGDPETVEQASGRAIELLEAPTRAMTIVDIGDLCRGLPGTLVARADVLPNHLPGLAGVRASGVTTVVIAPEAEAQRPIPSSGLLTTVAAYLEVRRIVGSRLVVIGPQYVEVSVRARLKAVRGVDPGSLRQAVEAAVAEFLHPLRGGESREGWPLGRDVYRAEILQLLDAVPGVDHVLSLELSADNGPPACGNLCLPATGLTVSGRHHIEVS
ncbi:MAG: putative baseplate assembly protein, partial [Bryobacteraceae bacterium]